MASSDYMEVLNRARDRFIEGDYATAEPLLQQVLRANAAVPEVYQILGTIYYDQGKFNRAIKHFKRALEINPSYTDASIGLSIILNDLGRYGEGREVFEKAQAELETTKAETPEPFIQDRIGSKHVELGDLYSQMSLWTESLEHYYRALNTLEGKPEIRLKIADALQKQGDVQKATRELKLLVKEHPNFMAGLLRLGTLYYESRRIADAIDVFERVLMRDPDNAEAKRYLSRAQSSDKTVSI